jgi:hypothetical protein
LNGRNQPCILQGQTLDATKPDTAGFPSGLHPLHPRAGASPDPSGGAPSSRRSGRRTRDSHHDGTMVKADAAGTWRLGETTVNRVGLAAMRLSQNGRAFDAASGPRDRRSAIRTVRTAVELGVNHIDTAAFYFSSLRSANEPINRAWSGSSASQGSPRRSFGRPWTRPRSSACKIASVSRPATTAATCWWSAHVEIAFVSFFSIAGTGRHGGPTVRST